MKKAIREFKNKIVPSPIITSYADKYIQIFSHPRSGTHFLEAFVGENFYRGEDLFVKNVEWGHWSNRKINSQGNKFQKLFGSHLFPRKECSKINYPSLYIYRDGRAVAYSIWNTENFVNLKFNNLSFSEFLKLKIDWVGSPAFKSKEKYTIAQHWERHVDGWLKYSKNNKNILVLKYEDLINDPIEVYYRIHERFFNTYPALHKDDINIINNAVGLKPNEAKKDSWRKKFTKEDESYFVSQLNNKEILEQMQSI
ncbi:sulfotransferase domain-containing protein [Leeuwenhoekiella sp. A16]|uniref:sulfotransferase domain-containing protein n=1 Tax=Leeuwenhoekiella sp. A16 TaxID=3141462 RepID=UPI003A7FC6DA